MNLEKETSENFCPRTDISAYIDGELTSDDELHLEHHLAECSLCSAELNEQKNFLRALDICLDAEREIELPKDFLKIVVAKAESNVSGLRQPKERFNAVFVCAALFLLVVFGLGSEINSVIGTFIKFGEQILTVASFVWHLGYDLSIACAVVLRSLSYQVVFRSSASFAFVFVFFAATMLVLTKLIARFNQA